MQHLLSYHPARLVDKNQIKNTHLYESCGNCSTSAGRQGQYRLSQYYWISISKSNIPMFKIDIESKIASCEVQL